MEDEGTEQTGNDRGTRTMETAGNEGLFELKGSLSTLDDRLRSVETGLAKLQAKTDIMATKEGVADLRTEIEKASHEATKNQRNTILVACGVAIAATLSLALWAFQWVAGAG